MDGRTNGRTDNGFKGVRYKKQDSTKQIIFLQCFGLLLLSFLGNKEAVELGRKKARMILAGLQPDWLVRGNRVRATTATINLLFIIHHAPAGAAHCLSCSGGDKEGRCLQGRGGGTDGDGGNKSGLGLVGIRCSWTGTLAVKEVKM